MDGCVRVGVCVCFNVPVIHCVSERVYSSKMVWLPLKARCTSTPMWSVWLLLSLTLSLRPYSVLCLYICIWMYIYLFPSHSHSPPPSLLPLTSISEIFHHKLVDETYTLSPDGVLFSWSKDLKFQRSVKCNETKTVSQAVVILECQLLLHFMFAKTEHFDCTISASSSILYQNDKQTD